MYTRARRGSNPTLAIIKGDVSPGDRLITTARIGKGDLVVRIRGYRVVRAPTFQTVQIGTHRHAVALGSLASLNHHCNPNVLVDTSRMVCIAIRDIRPREELSYFYPSTEWEMARPFLCVCGAENCIRIVAGARYLSSDVLARYFINEHVCRAIAREVRRGRQHALQRRSTSLSPSFR
jgi:hypothetical protein